MSDLMDKAVLTMPYELAMGDELSRMQFWSRVQLFYKEQHSRIEADEALMRQALERLEENRPDIGRVESAVYMRDYYDASITALRTRLDALPPPPVQGGAHADQA
jgi:hypothetical protein